MRLAGSFILLLLITLLAGCSTPGSATPTPAASTHVQVVTTISVLADLVHQVGGDRVRVAAILPPGASPEEFQPGPQDVQTIADAEVVFYNGYGLEEWLEPLFDAAEKPGQRRVELAEGLPALDAGGEFAEGNPHFWLDPDYAIVYVERIRDALSQLDPEGAERYARNAERYIGQIRELDQQLMALVESVPVEQRKLVTNHDAFPYFAQHYGFTTVGNILGSAEEDPSAGDLATLVERIKQEQVKAVFAESQFNQELAQTLAEEAGVEVVATLYTDSLDPAAGISTYLDLMRYNVETIVKALKS